MALSNAVERSTYAVTVAFTDDAGDAVTPSSATWTLTDKQGTVVNSRDAVTISGLSTSVTLVLSGADLAVGSPYFGAERVLTIEAVYTSDLGAGLPLKSETTFTISDLLNVP